MNSPDENRLRDSLAAAADEVETAGDFSGPAIRLARRRRRTALVASGAAAAVVLVAGAGVAAWGDGLGPRPAPSPTLLPATRTLAPVTPSPSPTASATPTSSATPTRSVAPPVKPTPARTPLTLGELWALDGTIHVNGRTVRLAGNQVVSDLAGLSDGRLLVRVGPARSYDGRYVVMDTTGRVRADLGSRGVDGAVTDGSLIALANPDRTGGSTVVDTRGRKVASGPATENPTDLADGWVLLVDPDTQKARLWDPRTGSKLALPTGTRRLSDDGRRAMGSTDAAPEGERCWFVVDLTTSTPRKVLERCGDDENPEGFAAGEISPDGRWLLGSSYTDGGFYFRMAVADARTGEVVVGRATHGDGVAGWTWEFTPSGKILFSRNTARPASPAVRNDLVRCTVRLVCTQVGKDVTLADAGGGLTYPRYVVGELAP